MTGRISTMTLLQQRKLEIYGDHYQFYVSDAHPAFAAPEDYTKEDGDHRLKVGDHIVAVLTDRYEVVPLEIEIHDAEPPYDAAQWDHIVECSLEITQGALTIEECCGDTIEKLYLVPAWYRLRSFHGGLG